MNYIISLYDAGKRSAQNLSLFFIYGMYSGVLGVTVPQLFAEDNTLPFLLWYNHFKLL